MIYNSFKDDMVEKVNLEFRLRKTDETRNHIFDEIKYNDLLSEKYKKTCKYLRYAEHLLLIASIVAGCVSISEFASLVCVPADITCSTIGIKICAITAGIKKHKSIIKQKKKKYDKMLLLGKDKLNTIKIS